jgi:hypothetical protein
MYTVDTPQLSRRNCAVLGNIQKRPLANRQSGYRAGSSRYGTAKPDVGAPQAQRPVAAGRHATQRPRRCGCPTAPRNVARGSLQGHAGAMERPPQGSCHGLFPAAPRPLPGRHGPPLLINVGAHGRAERSATRHHRQHIPVSHRSQDVAKTAHTTRQIASPTSQG